MKTIRGILDGVSGDKDDIIEHPRERGKKILTLIIFSEESYLALGEHSKIWREGPL